eukprot:3375395-Prymnesium_polylepis.1
MIQHSWQPRTTLIVLSAIDLPGVRIEHELTACMLTPVCTQPQPRGRLFAKAALCAAGKVTVCVRRCPR